jgi:hypothetical protein
MVVWCEGLDYELQRIRPPAVKQNQSTLSALTLQSPFVLNIHLMNLSGAGEIGSLNVRNSRKYTLVADSRNTRRKME